MPTIIKVAHPVAKIKTKDRDGKVVNVGIQFKWTHGRFQNQYQIDKIPDKSALIYEPLIKE